MSWLTESQVQTENGMRTLKQHVEESHAQRSCRETHDSENDAFVHAGYCRPEYFNRNIDGSPGSPEEVEGCVGVFGCYMRWLDVLDEIHMLRAIHYQIHHSRHEWGERTYD